MRHIKTRLTMRLEHLQVTYQPTRTKRTFQKDIQYHAAEADMEIESCCALTPFSATEFWHPGVSELYLSQSIRGWQHQLIALLPWTTIKYVEDTTVVSHMSNIITIHWGGGVTSEPTICYLRWTSRGIPPLFWRKSNAPCFLVFTLQKTYWIINITIPA